MAEKQLSGTRVLMVVAPEQFRDEELLEPKRILEAQGAKVAVASTCKGTAKGMLGATVNPDMLIVEACARDFDAVTVVGGMGSPDFLWPDANLHRLLVEMHNENKVVAGICLSGAVLAKAGVLKGKKATVWPTPESLKVLEEGNAKYEKKPLVIDGKAITAEGPQAASDFGQAIVNLLMMSKSGAKV